MGTTKEIVAASGVSDQQSLVKAMLSGVANKPVKLIIPGGTHLFKQGLELDSAGLQKRLYTWLRRVREFDECTLSFARTPSKYNLNLVKVVDFPTGLGTAIWNVPSKGKNYLSRIMAEQIASATKPPVIVVAKLDGLYIGSDSTGGFGPTAEDWEPYIEFKKSRKEQYSVY